MQTDYQTLFSRARSASEQLALLDDAAVRRLLLRAAEAVEAGAAGLLDANVRDCAAMPASDPLKDRLLLTPERLAAIAADMRSVAALPSPVGERTGRWVRPNGMVIERCRVPLGVVGVVYEARPNVTFDIFSLCLRTSNACVLKGGSDARHTNAAAAALLCGVLEREGVDPAALTMLPPDREAVEALLGATGMVDVVIPRGSARLIDLVRRMARVPVIETGAGIVHAYFDRAGDLEKGRRIVFNAKTRRVSVCNALDCLLLHRDRLADAAALCEPLAQRQVTIHADEQAYGALEGHYPAHLLQPAQERHYGTEFLDYRMALRTVPDLEAALAHIARYSSRHSEAIITEEPAAADAFRRRVDAACVYVNLPTSFTDGGEFGFGAEVGISTQKLHVRGPMGLEALTSYKYIVTGNGQVRD